MNITLRTIPHQTQRYETVGDWKTRRGQLREVLVSEMGSDVYAFLVAVHELVEARLCVAHGITQKDVDRFDMEYEAHRAPENTDEPGDDPTAPYYAEHQFASAIERRVADELGVDWAQYEHTILALSKD